MRPVAHMNLESYFMGNRPKSPCALHCTTTNHYLWPHICSLAIHGLPTFVPRRDSGLNFFALAYYPDDVHEDNAQFYSSSVHLYLVPKNILY